MDSDILLEDYYYLKKVDFNKKKLMNTHAHAIYIYIVS